MAIEAIASIGANVGGAEAGASVAVQHSDFSAVVGQGIQSVDGALKAADQAVRALAAGHEVATHDAMISLEEARMQLMLLSEVRNRVIEAYQELSRMQL